MIYDLARINLEQSINTFIAVEARSNKQHKSTMQHTQTEDSSDNKMWRVLYQYCMWDGHVPTRMLQAVTPWVLRCMHLLRTWYGVAAYTHQKKKNQIKPAV